MYSYIILGAGVGKAIQYDLADQLDTGLVAILDKDKSVFNISKTLSKRSLAKCEYIISNLDQLDLVSLFRNFNVVISALPAKENITLTEAAVEAKVHFCDLGGVIDITQKQKKFHALAKKSGVAVIPDCGLMPGMGIVIAKQLMSEFDKVRSITIYVGGLPQKPRPPINYQRVFNLDGLASICYEESPVLIEGKVKNLPPFSEKEIFCVEELKRFFQNGTIEAFVTAGASIAPWTLRDMGLKNFCEKTVRWPGFIDFVKDIPRSEFKDRISSHISTPVTKKDPDLVWMKIEAIGYKSGKLTRKEYSLLDLFNEKTGLTAMEHTTGFATAIIARMMAQGLSLKGVNTPETAFDDHSFEILWKRLNKEFKFNSNA